jgi:SAM-dependent methyltransferase
MEPREEDCGFGATIAQVYERHLVPLLFEPYAAIVADRLAELQPTRVLEVASGTGVLTRAMSSRLPTSVEIVATDLNRAMLDRAMTVGTRRPVQWHQADAQALPFGDATVDVVVCQFGAMFFPDKRRAFAEARRVLAPGGTFLFTVWDRIEENELAETVTASVAAQFPQDPPVFLHRTPHGYFDRSTIAADLRGAGFAEPASVVTVAARSRAAAPRIPAVAYCEGTPLRTEIEARRLNLAEATRRAEESLARRFGTGAVDGKMQAHLVTSSVR